MHTEKSDCQCSFLCFSILFVCLSSLVWSVTWIENLFYYINKQKWIKLEPNCTKPKISSIKYWLNYIRAPRCNSIYFCLIRYLLIGDLSNNFATFSLHLTIFFKPSFADVFHKFYVSFGFFQTIYEISLLSENESSRVGSALLWFILNWIEITYSFLLPTCLFSKFNLITFSTITGYTFNVS